MSEQTHSGAILAAFESWWQEKLRIAYSEYEGPNKRISCAGFLAGAKWMRAQAVAIAREHAGELDKLGQATGGCWGLAHELAGGHASAETIAEEIQVFGGTR